MSDSMAPEVLVNGRVFRVERQAFTLPDGRSSRLEVVRHPGAAAIVPLLVEPDAPGGGVVLMLRQYRAVLAAWIDEIPAGTRSAEEDLLACAARELEEETGYRATTLEPLGTIWPAPGYTDEAIALYLSRGLVRGQTALDADEALSVHEVPLATAVARAVSGEIADAKSAVALMRAAAHLGLLNR